MFAFRFNCLIKEADVPHSYIGGYSFKVSNLLELGSVFIRWLGILNSSV